MKFAILGCGYVADFYMATLAAYPKLQLQAVYDRDPERLGAFSDHYSTTPYRSFEELLDDTEAEMVINLTNPRSHFETTWRCLDAGKHVYSEKPLAMDSEKAAELVALARERGLGLASAPCSLLGNAAQTLWKAVREGTVSPVRLVYASFDDGMIHRNEPLRWRSRSGAPWPAKDEFEVGCTYEHAAYVLSWLAAIFGPARTVHAYASTQIEDKGVDVDAMAPDFTSGCIEYDGGVVARVTCSVISPLDKSITIVGEKGVLQVRNVRDDTARVYVQRTPRKRLVAGVANRLGHLSARLGRTLRLPFSISAPRIERTMANAGGLDFKRAAINKPVDFMRGPAELEAAIRERRACRLSPELGLHIVEIVETLQQPERFATPRRLRTTFDPIEPLHFR